MNQPPITCELVDERELDRLYVAGKLSDEEAAAFEQHYFGCDRCWALVKGGSDVRAAHARGATVVTPWRRTWMMPLTIAAGIMLAAIGTWRFVGPNGNPIQDAVRGGSDSIAVKTTTSAGRWQAAWPSVPGAVLFRIRIYSDDGRLLLTRETNDTVVQLSTDSLATLGEGRALYLDVQQMDQLQQPVGRSALIPIPRPGAR